MLIYKTDPYISDLITGGQAGTGMEAFQFTGFNPTGRSCRLCEGVIVVSPTAPHAPGEPRLKH